MIITQANYATVKATLESIGFTNLPAPTEIAWTAPSPCTLAAVLSLKKSTVQNEDRTVA